VGSLPRVDLRAVHIRLKSAGVRDPYRRTGYEVSIRGSLREQLLDHRNGWGGSLREQRPPKWCGTSRDA
jgi:hypothetical protein